MNQASRIETPAAGRGPVENERRCAACGHLDMVDVYRVFDRHIIRCTACSFMQTYPRPTLADLEHVYSENYFTNQELVNPSSSAIFGYYDYLAERLNKQAKYKGILEKLCRYIEAGSVDSRDILDVGCGYGFFLDSSVDFGFTPFGLEFNEHAMAQLRRRYAFAVERSEGSIRDAFPGRSFASVVMLDTIEHLVDPFKALADIREKLVPQGMVAISTMDSTSFTSRLLGARLEDFRRINEHLFFFDRRTLRAALERAGFDVLEVRSIGHTFELGVLLGRISASLPILRPAFTLAKALRLEHVNVSLNPLTKMIVYARRR
jgi:2-polyprenyl-3-methyl-5-hydroxy-6-metoxy-1,4-benzoquinol methylase